MSKRAKHSSAGASIVEFLFALPIVIGLLAATYDFARLLYTKQMMQAAAKRGANEASVALNVDSEDRVKQVAALENIQTETARFFEMMSPLSAHVDFASHSYRQQNQPFSVGIYMPSAVNYNNDIRSALEAEPIMVSVEADFNFIFPFLDGKRLRVTASRYRELPSDSSQPISTDCLGNAANSGSGGSTNCPCSLVLAPPRDPSSETGSASGGCICVGGTSRRPPEVHLQLVGGDISQMPAACAAAFDQNLNPRFGSPAYRNCQRQMPCTACNLSCGANQVASIVLGNCRCSSCPAGSTPNADNSACVCTTPPTCPPNWVLTPNQCACVPCTGNATVVNGQCVCNAQTQQLNCAAQNQVPAGNCGCRPCVAPQVFDPANTRCACLNQAAITQDCLSRSMLFNPNTCACAPCTGGLVFQNGQCVCPLTATSCPSPLILQACLCVLPGRGE